MIVLRMLSLLRKKEFIFIDCGTSGGIKGAREGACLMVGGAPEAVKVLTPFLKI